MRVNRLDLPAQQVYKNIMTERIFNFTPPARDAVVELAEAYHRYLVHSAGATEHRKMAATRLLAAQDAFGLELISRRVLEFQIALPVAA